jgi:hypothetical protein
MELALKGHLWTRRTFWTMRTQISATNLGVSVIDTRARFPLCEWMVNNMANKFDIPGELDALFLGG